MNNDKFFSNDFLVVMLRKAVDWAYDKSMPPMWITSGTGTWHALCGSVARLFDEPYANIQHDMTKIAFEKYGEHWYAILWAHNHYSTKKNGVRRPRGVAEYLRRVMKRGEIG